uniref:Uncharacterized protein n=1 Tax=Brassica oleracea var. oleracea TaxID=109376 RepID=A0A0D3BUU7_BRAOL
MSFQQIQLQTLNPISIHCSSRRREELTSTVTCPEGMLAGGNVVVDAVVYLVDAYDKERFTESKRELDALPSDEAIVVVRFLILGNKIDIPYAAPEDELRYHLGLTNFTTGKGRVTTAGGDSGVHPLEVFVTPVTTYLENSMPPTISHNTIAHIHDSTHPKLK